MVERIKASEVVGLLEKLSIENYALYNYPLTSNRTVEFEEIGDYYKIVKDLDLMSIEGQNGGVPDYTYQLISKYKGWDFEVKVKSTDSKARSIIDKFKEENIVIEGVM